MLTTALSFSDFCPPTFASAVGNWHSEIALYDYELQFPMVRPSHAGPISRSESPIDIEREDGLARFDAATSDCVWVVGSVSSLGLDSEELL